MWRSYVIELWDGARSEDWKSEVEPQEGKGMKDWKRRLSGMQATNTKAKTKNEKRLSGMQATEIMNTEILKPEKPEFLKTDFLEEKFKNEFLLKAEQQALQVLAKHQQQRQKSQMKGGSSFASKYQAGPSVEEKCPTAKEGFGNIFHDEGLENGMQLTVISVLLGKPFDVSTDFCLQYQFHSDSVINNEMVELEKELVRMLKLEDHSDHKNWDSRGKRMRKRVRITVRSR